MSLSETDDGRPFERAGDAKVIAARFVEIDGYEPDLTAYAVDQQNDVQGKFRAAVQSRKGVTMTWSTIAYDGQRESVELNAAEVKQYCKLGMKERRKFAFAKVQEKRKAVAIGAAKIVRERGTPIEKLPPYAEACLKEFDAIEYRRKRVPLREGGYAMPLMPVLREDAFANGGNDISGGSAGYLDQEWLNYSGPAGQQLYLSDIWDALAKTFYAWHHDPVAFTVCSLIRNFVIGRGVKVEADDPQVQAVIDEFDALNDMENRIKLWVVGESRDGELFIRKIKVGDGTTKVRSLSPDTIWDVVTDAEDIETVYWYAQRYQTRTQMFEPPTGDGMHYVSRDLPADEIIHSKLNCAESEVRGRSDLFVILGNLKKLRDLTDTMVLKDQALAAYQYDFTVKGNQEDINGFAATALPKGKPQPGSYFVHNDQVTVQTVNSGKNQASAGKGSSFEMLMTLCAIGVGIAKDYIGITSTGSRANALVSTEPSAMTFEERQDHTGSMLTKLYRDVLKEAALYGKLKNVTKGLGFKVVFPSIEKADTGDRIDHINTGVSMGFISHETAAGLYASEIDMGDDYDYDQECAKIVEERSSKMPPLIMTKYSNVPMGDAATGAAGEDPAQAPVAGATPPRNPRVTPGPQQQPQGTTTASPLSRSGASDIKNDLGPQNRERSIVERWTAYP